MHNAGELAGTRIQHAWVKIDGIVFDYSNGYRNEINTKHFYEQMNVEVHARYTAREANMLCVMHEHFGPWDEQS